MASPAPEPAPPLPRSRWIVYLLIALAAFVAGMAFGQWGQPPGGTRSRVDWPEPTTHP